MPDSESIVSLAEDIAERVLFPAALVLGSRPAVRDALLKRLGANA